MQEYKVTGMSCAACSAHVEKAVSKVDGVDSVAVSLLTNSMTVEGTAAPKEIIAAVSHAGYGASLKADKNTQDTERESQEEQLQSKETITLRNRLIASLVLLIPLMYVSMGYTMWDWPLPAVLAENHLAIGILEMLFTIAIMFINQKFFISGVMSALHLSPNMDTLVALGSGASFGYSVYALLAMTDAVVKTDMEHAMHYMHEFYFESAAMILTLITLGKMLESYSKGRTTDALKNLMKLAPKTAVLIKDGVETVVSIEQVKPGDIFAVRPGESVPVDGTILEGSSALNESALTGESIPVDKQPGDMVSAATLNDYGYLKCQAVRVGEDTALSKIIKMVRDASATKAPIAKAADKVSYVFVPTVIVLAVITIIVWLLAGKDTGFALARGVSVLVISCPCALGLATPVAIMVGNGMGAKNGILFKNAVALEETGKAKMVALDKTGTITKGEPEVTDVLPADHTDRDALLSLAYRLESKSGHPLAKAIIKYCEEYPEFRKGREVEDFQAVAGNGLSAKLDGKEVFGGKREFIEEKVRIPEDVLQKSWHLAEQGKTPLFFAQDGKFCGIIAVADTLKEDSVEAISRLKKMGMKVVMLTGDNERTAKAVAKLAGVDEVRAGVLPEGKDEVIRELKKEGKTIMVGDGINDAPALTSADIGAAIGAGTDVAMDAADLVLMKSSLMDVCTAIHLSRAVLRNIHENLFWAFFYNVIGIPLAAGVYYPLLRWKLNPMFGAAAMSLSSFCVVMNALRLNLFRADKQSLQIEKKEEKEEKKEISEMEENTKVIEITGMMCGHCEAHVKKALEEIPQVDSAEASHEKGTAVVKLNAPVDDEVLKKAVEAQDYKVTAIR